MKIIPSLGAVAFVACTTCATAQTAQLIVIGTPALAGSYAAVTATSRRPPPVLRGISSSVTTSTASVTQ